MWRPIDQGHYEPVLRPKAFAAINETWTVFMQSPSPALQHIAIATWEKRRDNLTKVSYESPPPSKPLQVDYDGELALRDLTWHFDITGPILKTGETFFSVAPDMRPSLVATQLAFLYQWPWESENDYLELNWANRLYYVCSRVLEWEKEWTSQTGMVPYSLGTGGDIRTYLGEEAYIADFGLMDFQRMVMRVLESQPLHINQTVGPLVAQVATNPLTTIFLRDAYRDQVYKRLKKLTPDPGQLPSDDRALKAAEYTALALIDDIASRLEFPDSQ